MLGAVWMEEMIQPVPRGIDIGVQTPSDNPFDAQKRFNVACPDNESGVGGEQAASFPRRISGMILL
jgi:hypothetical protein